MAPKTGRPKSENPRNIRLEIRLSEDENKSLIECAEILEMTKTDVIVKGLKMVRSELDEKNAKK